VGEGLTVDGARAMMVGTGRIVLDFYNNTEAPKKRKLLEELCTMLRKKYNVSALEVADFDDPERCVVGFAAVIPENWKMPSARSFVEKVAKEIDETAFARVTVEDLELLEHGSSPGYEQE
jgi:uncharacterized protein YlxP (DUF503 family)